MTNLDLDWIDFHAQGLELARRLKAEVGPTAEVRYCKPMEDPNQNLEPLRYVLDDGSVVAEESEEPDEQEPWPTRQIHSGGQTGADRAALDWAIAYRIIHGGGALRAGRPRTAHLPAAISSGRPTPQAIVSAPSSTSLSATPP